MRKELTNDFARTVAPTPGKISRYFDTHKRAPRGFLLRVTPAGARAWAVQYRVNGRQREITIGEVQSWPITESRKRGHELRREIDAGGDPLGERETARHAPDVAALVDRFIEEELPKRASRTQAEYRAMLRDWVMPALGRKKIAAIEHQDVDRLHQKITSAGKPRRANAVKSLVSTLFNRAIVWHMRADNPAKGVEANPEHGRARYLSADEIDRLMAVLERWRHDRHDQDGNLIRKARPDSVDAITLALLTGARRGEILGMQWADLDLDAAVWSKPPMSTKQRRAHRVPLSDVAVAVLRHREVERTAAGKIVRLHADDVFRGGGDKTACNRLEKDWFIIRAEAGLSDLRFHDLRHSFASVLAGAGQSLPVIGAMLGHSKAQTTQRYSHLADQPLRDAADIVAKRLTRR